MIRSLRGRLALLLVLLVAAAIAAGILMLGLYRQSAVAQIGQASAEIGRACDAIGGAYRFFSAGWTPSAQPIADPKLRRDLISVVQTALRDRTAIEGGVWQDGAGSLAYAFPTYEGSGPKTDVPEAELPRIAEVNRAAHAEDRQVASRYDGRSQTLLLTACPLPGPIVGLTAWTMTRAITVGGAYRQLMAGLAVLLAAVLAATAMLARLTLNWSRHVARIETALAVQDMAALRLEPTGELELDRIVRALNETGARLAAARERANQLARQVATGERLVAIGRVAAGVAHEIRNPIAAMRLKAENAIAGGAVRQREALSVVMEQVDRLDALLGRLLSVTQRDPPRYEWVALAPFIELCLAVHTELAAAKEVRFDIVADDEPGWFDPEQMRRALDNLVLNAIAAAPTGSRIGVAARHGGQQLMLTVRDAGSGPPSAIRDHLFEPFVTARADGTGLGLSIVREVAEAHGGSARLAASTTETIFEIDLPCPQS
jgi:signal transduction histidine kinase